MTYPITPDPGIHVMPSWGAPNAPTTKAQATVMTDAMLDIIIAHILALVANISIFGIYPFGGLRGWSAQLLADAEQLLTGGPQAPAIAKRAMDAFNIGDDISALETWVLQAIEKAIDDIPWVAGLLAWYHKFEAWVESIPLLHDLLVDLQKWEAKVKEFLDGLVDAFTKHNPPPGFDGMPTTTAKNFWQNLSRFLADIDFFSPTFSVHSAAKQFIDMILGPYGVITSVTELPAHLLATLAPNAETNRAPQFTEATISGNTQWHWSASTEAISALGPGVRELLGVPFAVGANDWVSVGITVGWSGFDASAENPSGTATNVAAAAYFTDANETLISEDYVATVPSLDSGTDIWGVALIGQARVPTGAKYVRLKLYANMPAGAQVWMWTPVVELQNLVDAGLLGAIENIPNLAVDSITGFLDVAQGLGDSLQHWLDGLATALTSGTIVDGQRSSAQALTGVSFAQLFGLAQQTAKQAADATLAAQSNAAAVQQNTADIVTINNQLNKTNNPPPAAVAPAEVATQYNTAGSYTWTPPSWMATGDYVDVILLGSGQSGAESTVPFIPGNGGAPGLWSATTLTAGTDIEVGSQIPITVPAGGVAPASGGVAGEGTVGSEATATYVDMSNAYATLTAAGGSGGSYAQGASDGVGLGPGNENYNSTTYFGGSSVGPGANGSPPGGGGGAQPSPFEAIGSGAPGYAVIIARPS